MSKRNYLSTNGNYNIINHLETGEKQSGEADIMYKWIYSVVGVGHIIYTEIINITFYIINL